MLPRHPSLNHPLRTAGVIRDTIAKKITGKVAQIPFSLSYVLGTPMMPAGQLESYNTHHALFYETKKKSTTSNKRGRAARK